MGEPRTKSWNNPITFNARDQHYSGGVRLSDVHKSLTLADYGTLQDENNRWPRTKGLAADVGGPLLCYRVRHDFPVASDYISSGLMFGSEEWSISGHVVADFQGAQTAYSGATMNYIGSNLDSYLVRVGLGGTAISRCKPASPEASFGVFLAETYREGIPKLLSNFKVAGEVDHFRSLGSNYLNVEFGWKPFVSDLKKTARAVIHAQELIDDLRRNSGKRMRRQYRFPAVTSEKVIIRDQMRPWPYPVSYTLQQAERTVTQTASKETWFSGEFVYKYPSVDASIPSQIIAGARHLLGVDLTPETLWNITPWTWLADWFANTGDVMSNLSAITSDNLVMRYGYLMQEAIVTNKCVHTGVRTPKGSIPSIVKGSTHYHALSRIGASPYGFGTTWDGFSARQVAILASIGITRRGR